MGTVSKALSLLTYFSRSRTEIGLTDMVKLSGINKATVHRLLSELVQHGIIEQTAEKRHYRLGPALTILGSLREAAVPIREISKGILKRISELTGETAHLSLLRNELLHVVSFAYSSRHGSRVTMEDVTQITFHSTSSGLAVLSFSSQDFLKKVLSKPLEKHTSLTEINLKKIEKKLLSFRRNYLAESISGFELDVHSQACPIFDSSRRCIGAVAIAAPVSRMGTSSINVITSALRKAAVELTNSIGGVFPEDFKNLNCNE
jgi:DNA-binding IclR family transcriptional regulator